MRIPPRNLTQTVSPSIFLCQFICILCQKEKANVVAHPNNDPAYKAALVGFRLANWLILENVPGNIKLTDVSMTISLSLSVSHAQNIIIFYRRPSLGG